MDEMRRRMAELRAIVAGGPEGVAENVVPDYIEEFGDVEGIAEEILEGDNPEEVIEEANEETPELAADEEESLESPAESPEKISREQFEKELLIRAGLRSADGRIESMGEVTELYKKYFNGIDETIASMEELKSLEKNIQSIEVSKPTVPLEYDKLVSELKLAIDKAKSLKDINEKLNEKNKNTEEEKRKEEDLKEKIAKIENKIKELLERLKSGNFKDEDKESIEKEIGELFKELVGYKKELLELINLLKEDIEKESTELYGAKTTEELKRIRKEDTRRAPADVSAPERDSGATSPETGTPERPVAERSDSLGSFGATRTGTSGSLGEARTSGTYIRASEPVPAERTPSESAERASRERSSDGIPTIKLRPGHEAEDALWQRMRMPSYCDVENGKFYHAVRVGNELKYIGEKIDKEEYSKKTLIEKMDKILKEMGIDYNNNDGSSVLYSLRGTIGEDDIEKMERIMNNDKLEGAYNEIVGKPIFGIASVEVRMKLYSVLKDIEESKNPYKFFLIPRMLKNIDKPKDIEAYLEASRGMDNVERAPEHETPETATPAEEVPIVETPEKETPAEEVPTAEAPEKETPEEEIPTESGSRSIDEEESHTEIAKSTEWKVEGKEEFGKLVSNPERSRSERLFSFLALLDSTKIDCDDLKKIIPEYPILQKGYYNIWYNMVRDEIVFSGKGMVSSARNDIIHFGIGNVTEMVNEDALAELAKKTFEERYDRGDFGEIVLPEIQEGIKLAEEILEEKKVPSVPRLEFNRTRKDSEAKLEKEKPAEAEEQIDTNKEDAEPMHENVPRKVVREENKKFAEQIGYPPEELGKRSDRRRERSLVRGNGRGRDASKIDTTEGRRNRRLYNRSKSGRGVKTSKFDPNNEDYGFNDD